MTDDKWMLLAAHLMQNNHAIDMDQCDVMSFIQKLSEQEAIKLLNTCK